MAMLNKPKLVVFDLDYTLWPFWVDTHVDPPFQKRSNVKVVDRHGHTVEYYQEVPSVLERLHSQGYTMAIASRTSATQEAKQLMGLFNWDGYFTYKEIYPGRKTTHFNKFHEYSKIPLKEMLFFDDEQRNIVDLTAVGVTCVLVEEGVTQKVVDEGLEKFAKNAAKS